MIVTCAIEHFLCQGSFAPKLQTKVRALAVFPTFCEKPMTIFQRQ